MMTDQAATTKRSGKKGPRPKHVPVRTCVICRGQSAKRGLVRIVRQPDGLVLIDETGRLNGRGAYLCDKPGCWERAASGEVLAKALKAELTPALREALRRYAIEHLDEAAPAVGSGK